MTLDVRADADRLAALALAEDGTRDVTSDITVPSGAAGRGVLLFKGAGVLAGLAYADAVARAYADAVAGTGARILHTRKTAPGLRLLDVSAALAGGAGLHRLELASTVLVKDNHWQALRAGAGSLEQALADARALGVTGLQVEVESEAQVGEAVAAGATRLLVDNQTPVTVRRWAALAREVAPAIEIEATGGITLENVRRYADAGADFISVGALTHSVSSADISLELSPDTAFSAG